MTIESGIGQSPNLRFTVRRTAICTFFAAYLVFQVVVPALRLPGPDDRPFGWQMYSTVSNERYDVTFADGSTETIDPADFVLRLRSEADLGENLPPFLCDRLPAAAEVRVSSPVGGTTELYRCRS
jgi:hypothetical protein